MNAEDEAYLDRCVSVWRAAFVYLLGCSTDYADEMATFWRKPQVPLIFDHFGPLDYFVSILERLLPGEQRDGLERVRIEEAMLVALLDGPNVDPLACTTPEFDWEHASSRLDNLVRTYGVTLDEMRKRVQPSEFYFRKNSRQ